MEQEEEQEYQLTEMDFNMQPMDLAQKTPKTEAEIGWRLRRFCAQNVCFVEPAKCRQSYESSTLTQEIIHVEATLVVPLSSKASSCHRFVGRSSVCCPYFLVCANVAMLKL